MECVPDLGLLTNEDLFKKHRQERRELQARIQSMKKGVPKGDKKKRKEINELALKLEKELDAKQSEELVTEKPNDNNMEADTDTMNSVEHTEEPAVNTRTSRAKKRREKKELEEREREKRIQEQAEVNKEGPRIQEINAIKESLKALGLQLYNIAADGNCLYCAINHQLHLKHKQSYSVPKLRSLTSDFIRENKEELMPFMYNDSEEAVSEEQFEEYCKEVATTKLWGGQLELRALSQILKCPIKVIQASGPPTLQGESFDGPELVLTYHRHLYKLGEHYNSTMPVSKTVADESDSDSNP